MRMNINMKIGGIEKAVRRMSEITGLMKWEL